MIATAKHNGHGLVRLTFNDGRPVMDVPPTWPELVAWDEQPGNSVAAAEAPPAELPEWQLARKAAYLLLSIALGKQPAEVPASFENTIGHLLDMIITQVEVNRLAAGATRTAEFDALITAVAAIKAAHPAA